MTHTYIDVDEVNLCIFFCLFPVEDCPHHHKSSPVFMGCLFASIQMGQQQILLRRPVDPSSCPDILGSISAIPALCSPSKPLLDHYLVLLQLFSALLLPLSSHRSTDAVSNSHLPVTVMLPTPESKTSTTKKKMLADHSMAATFDFSRQHHFHFGSTNERWSVVRAALKPTHSTFTFSISSSSIHSFHCAIGLSHGISR